MKKHTVLSIPVLLAAIFAGCNSSSGGYQAEPSTSVAVNTFSLTADSKVMAGLDSVFFSIDLENAQIYNADSLPKGTNVTKLLPVITMVENISAATLKVTRSNGTDTVYDYLKSATDSIDFTNPVILTVASGSGTVTRDYTIKVNVHTMESDSLSWGETARRRLPSSLSAPIRQHSTMMGGKYYCLTNASTQWCLAVAGAPDGTWTFTSSPLPSGADIESFTGTDDALYIIIGDTVYTSTDGASWQTTAVTADYLYGAYGKELIGVRTTDGTPELVYYPSGRTEAVPAGMPVKGASQAVPVKFGLSESLQVYITGGILADGSRTGATWAYDGNAWACISNVAIPQGLSGMVLVPYYTFYKKDNVTSVRYSAFIALGGTDGKKVNRTVYVSNDYGMTWTAGSSLMQLPPYLPSLAGAQGFVADKTLYARSADEWEYFTAQSRATEPIREWECPYIYLFGGITEDGYLSPYVWRGAINRLTFKPIQ
ncbi:MAG: hypothetical protein K2M55_09310 [Muribaculaceae bacterium]|nr:hypothetical protein [Muribaculaceae bacterium]